MPAAMFAPLPGENPFRELHAAKILERQAAKAGWLLDLADLPSDPPGDFRLLRWDVGVCATCLHWLLDLDFANADRSTLQAVLTDFEEAYKQGWMLLRPLLPLLGTVGSRQSHGGLAFTSGAYHSGSEAVFQIAQCAKAEAQERLDPTGATAVNVEMVLDRWPQLQLALACDLKRHRKDLSLAIVCAGTELRELAKAERQSPNPNACTAAGDAPWRPGALRQARPQVQKLLPFMWAKKTAELEDIWPVVWGERMPADEMERRSKYDKAQQKANAFLQGQGCKVVLSRDLDVVTLVE